MAGKRISESFEAGEELTPSPPTISPMFSAASFYDIVHGGDVDLPVSKSELESSRTPIVAFYGFKGGAGRSTALGYVAALLARQGRRVGIVDLDLEAPGLAQLFGFDTDVAEKGSMELLTEAARTPWPRSLDASRQMLTVPDSLGAEGGRIEILPAGKIDDTYLAQLEELGVGLWHAYEPERPNPLRRLLQELAIPERDALFLDCRTGFTALSATAMFHVADAIVVFLPVSDQIWDGVTILRDAFIQAKQSRGSAPTMIFVPSMVLSGKEGKARLENMISRLRSELLDAIEATEEDALPTISILEGGIEQDPRVWSVGKVQLPLGAVGPQDNFRQLVQALAPSVRKNGEYAEIPPIDRKHILAGTSLSERFAYGENLSLQEIEETLIDSEDARAAVDRSIQLVIGAKGAGKSFLWKYLVDPKRTQGLLPVPSDVEFLVGTPPRNDKEFISDSEPILSKDHYGKIEKDTGLVASGAHDVFWIYWCLQAIVRSRPSLAPILLQGVERRFRTKLEAFFESPGFRTIIPLLKSKDTAIEAGELLKSADNLLMASSKSLSIAFDGLDIGFQNTNPEDWTPRRDRYVVGLLQLLASWRPRLRRIQFKVFLREDIWLAVKMQNRSHLDPITRVLRFEEKDLWHLVLKVVRRDPACKEIFSDPATLLGDIEKLRQALFPLWGEKIEKGKRAYSANYVLNRIQDSKERIFPRTIMQLLQHSFKAETETGREARSDRLLQYPSLRAGIEEASRKRVKDLTDEYLELREYLEAMKGADPASTVKEFVGHLQQALSNGRKKSIVQYLESTIVPQLEEVGVLKVMRSEEKKAEHKILVARLYREGLDMKTKTGLK